MKRLLIIILICLFILSTGHKNAKAVEKPNSLQAMAKPYVLLISIDAFRHDYIQIHQPRFITKFKKSAGVIERWDPPFPSKTFTSHYGMVTGLWPENHGLVSNSFWDKTKGKRYSPSNRREVEDGSWYRGWPLWCVAEKSGVLSACFFWVGSEAPIQDIRPSYYYLFDSNVSYEKRAEQILNWFKLPEQNRPHFVTLYFEGVDTKGHRYGPYSKEVKKEIDRIDHILEHLYHELEKSRLPINIILLSDHGMLEVDTTKLVFLDDALDMEDIRYEIYGTHGFLYLNPNDNIDSIYNIIKDFDENMAVYKRPEFPENFHINDSSRCGDIVLAARPGAHICFHKDEKNIVNANHGYDPVECPEMSGFFLASGPNINEKTVIKQTDNIDLYHLVLKILDLNAPEKTDAKAAPILKLLKK